MLMLTISMFGNLYSQYICEVVDESVNNPRSEITNKYIPDGYTPNIFMGLLKIDKTLIVKQ